MKVGGIRTGKENRKNGIYRKQEESKERGEGAEEK
jgi:hypothetical protein